MICLSSADLRNIEFLFGDLSMLTPMQRLDLAMWYKNGSESSDADSDILIQKRIQDRLQKEPGLTLSVIRNRFKNKYTKEKISEIMSHLADGGIIEERKSTHGKSKYFLKAHNGVVGRI